MDFESFVEGPLLWIVFLLLIACILARLGFFSFKVIRDTNAKEPGRSSRPLIFSRFFLPFHKTVAKKPGFAVLRYAFHFCLFVVPIWLGGHVALWAESRFEWDWASLPDSWADRMTLLVMGMALFFIIRRTASPTLKASTSWADYVIILVAALPFFTGYFLTHGTLDSVPFLGNQMRLLHVLSGQAMMIMAAFLFCTTRLNPSKCTGCASCELSCPTGTIETKDSGTSRVFTYSHYQCICCGACVNTCPEEAAELRHEISARKLLQVIPKQEIRSVELKACQKCGALFVPEPLFDKIQRTFTEDYLLSCPNCRKTGFLDLHKRFSPWHSSKSETSHRPERRTAPE